MFEPGLAMEATGTCRVAILIGLAAGLYLADARRTILHVYPEQDYSLKWLI